MLLYFGVLTDRSIVLSRTEPVETFFGIKCNKVLGIRYEEFRRFYLVSQLLDWVSRPLAFTSGLWYVLRELFRPSYAISFLSLWRTIYG